ncbi:hypothetical protein Pcac1_g9370 [Phytophthora cactorum]|nr:hypothetical protein Pcac1_g9370 [Phytophthora cactorum]
MADALEHMAFSLVTIPAVVCERVQVVKCDQSSFLIFVKRYSLKTGFLDFRNRLWRDSEDDEHVFGGKSNLDVYLIDTGLGR